MSKRILVIEDNDETRELLRIALEKRGYQVTVAEYGVRGYDTALFLKPDLIVTDIQMPGADGVHVVRRVSETIALLEVTQTFHTAARSRTPPISLPMGRSALPSTPHETAS